MPRTIVSLAAVIALSLLSAAQEFKPPVVQPNAVETPSQLRTSQPPDVSQSADELERRGDLLRSEKAYADAIDHFRAALKKHPTSQLYNKIGIAQLQLLQHKDARKSFEEAIELDPNNADAFNNLGVVHYVDEMRKLDQRRLVPVSFRKPLKYYKKAIELKPERASYYSNLGTAYFSKRDYKKATEAYLRAVNLDPSIFERKREGGASAQVSTSIDQARHHYVIARMYSTAGDADQCLLYLRRALEAGFNISDAANDNAFARLRKDPRFQELIQHKPGLPE
jgi:tetratricopeptide (TPR) repeat protein